MSQKYRWNMFIHPATCKYSFLSAKQVLRWYRRLASPGRSPPMPAGRLRAALKRRGFELDQHVAVIPGGELDPRIHFSSQDASRATRAALLRRAMGCHHRVKPGDVKPGEVKPGNDASQGASSDHQRHART
jgi:hypothetical protein